MFQVRADLYFWLRLNSLEIGRLWVPGARSTSVADRVEDWKDCVLSQHTSCIVEYGRPPVSMVTADLLLLWLQRTSGVGQLIWHERRSSSEVGGWRVGSVKAELCQYLR